MNKQKQKKDNPLLADSIRRRAVVTSSVTKAVLKKASTSALLSLSQINPYELNPRQEPNALFEGLVDSIRQQGLIGTLAVTQRPGEETYVMYAGGNTTLRALKKVYSQDHKVPCEVYAYPENGDITLLGLHLIENDTRQELSLVDRAKAFIRIRQEIATHNQEKIRQGDLLKLVKELGYQSKLNQGTLSKLLFLGELSEYLPSSFLVTLSYRELSDLSAVEKAVIKKDGSVTKAALWKPVKKKLVKRKDTTAAAVCQFLTTKYKLGTHDNNEKVEKTGKDSRLPRAEVVAQLPAVESRAKDTLGARLGLLEEVDRINKKGNLNKMVAITKRCESLADVKELERMLARYDKRTYGRLLLWAMRR